jgi:hypothetical protein
MRCNRYPLDRLSLSTKSNRYWAVSTAKSSTRIATGVAACAVALPGGRWLPRRALLPGAGATGKSLMQTGTLRIDTLRRGPLHPAGGRHVATLHGYAVFFSRLRYCPAA